MKKIRVAILLDSLDVPAWMLEMIRIISAADYAEIVCTLLTGRPNPAPRIGFLHKNFLRFEKKRFRPRPDAFRVSSSAEYLGNIPVITSEQRGDGTFSEEVTNDLASHQPDVLLALSGRLPRGAMLSVPHFGTWTYTVPRERPLSVPVGFREFLRKHPRTTDNLYLLREPLDSCTILSQSVSTTDPASFLVGRSRHHWKILHLAPRLLRLLACENEDAFRRSRSGQNLFALQHMEEMNTSNLNLLGPLARHFLSLFIRKLRGMSGFDQWILLYSFGEELTTDLNKFRKMIPPRNTVWADPFIICRDNQYYLFIEECPRRPKKGRISVITMDKDGNYSRPRVILERPYHLSYPFLFEWEGNLYMIPESSANKTVELHRCMEFPYQWKFEKNLMTGVEAVDSTLLHHNGKWWLFCSIKENDGYANWDELFLFSAGSPVSDQWKPHPLNPVVSDVTRSRPAGKIIQSRGSLYRPSQDCSRRYGYGIRLNRIVRLTEQEYKEEEVGYLEPTWDPTMMGVHTLAANGRLTLVDGLYRRWGTG